MRVPVIHNVSVATSANSSAWTLDKHGTNAHEAFFYLECLCNAWFTFELMIRWRIDRTFIHLTKNIWGLSKKLRMPASWSAHFLFFYPIVDSFRVRTCWSL